MTDDQRFRFDFVRTNFPNPKKQEYAVASFNNETPRECLVELTDDFAAARRVASSICTGGGQAEVYRFDGVNLWLWAA